MYLSYKTSFVVAVSYTHLDKVNETKSYTYDTLGRLTKTVTTDHSKDDKTKTVTYTYDNVGNRLKEDDGTTTISYTYNGLDQLKTSTKEKGTAVEEVRQYDYDMNGNQTDVKNTKTGENQTCLLYTSKRKFYDFRNDKECFYNW